MTMEEVSYQMIIDKSSLCDDVHFVNDLSIFNIYIFNRFWNVCIYLALYAGKVIAIFNEFPHVSVITQLDFSRNGRLCDLRFMCLRYADMNCHN